MGNRRRRLVPRSFGSQPYGVVIPHPRCTTGRAGPLAPRRDGSRIRRLRLLRDLPRALSPHPTRRLTTGSAEHEVDQCHLRTNSGRIPPDESRSVESPETSQARPTSQTHEEPQRSATVARFELAWPRASIRRRRAETLRARPSIGHKQAGTHLRHRRLDSVHRGGCFGCVVFTESDIAAVVPVRQPSGRQRAVARGRRMAPHSGTRLPMFAASGGALLASPRPAGPQRRIGALAAAFCDAPLAP